MEPVFYVMAILGCGDGQAECRELRVDPARYQSAAQCQLAMAEVLPRHSDLMFPTIAASCQQRGALTARTEARAPKG